MMRMKPIRYFPDKQSILLKTVDWNLWLNKVKANDGRILFPLSVNKVTYDGENREFKYEKLRENPIWLSKVNILELIELLQEMISGVE